MTNNDYRINWKKLAITQEGEGTIIHPLVALLLTPIMGLAFLMFLPFAGFYLFAMAISHKICDMFIPIAHSPAVGQAFLTGNATSGKPEDNSELAEIAKEIDSRRNSK